MKKLAIVVAGTGNYQDVEIQPGTTAGDVLAQVNLRDYLLSRSPNEAFFASAEPIYDMLSTRERIAARDTPSSLAISDTLFPCARRMKVCTSQSVSPYTARPARKME